jgi:chemotaxis receptor (MCP) glutamine deamidase CheD
MTSAEPVVLRTLLGSCVAVCLRDPVSAMGGMNHILLPGSSRGSNSSRFGVHAMELLINRLMNLGADRRRLVAKAFGGANVLRDFQSPTIGEQNSSFVRYFLAAEGIPLLAERLGGQHAVQLLFHTNTGKACVHTVDRSRLLKISKDEESYSFSQSADRLPSGDVNIF